MQKNAPQQLLILRQEAYRQIKDDQDRRLKRDETFVNLADMFVQYLTLFINPEMFDEMKKQLEMKKNEKELTPEQFKKEFSQIEKMGLKRLYVPELEEEAEPEAPPLTPEMAAAFAGGGISEFRRLSSAFDDEIDGIKDMDHQPINVGMQDIDLEDIED